MIATPPGAPASGEASSNMLEHQAARVRPFRLGHGARGRALPPGDAAAGCLLLGLPAPGRRLAPGRCAGRATVEHAPFCSGLCCKLPDLALPATERSWRSSPSRSSPWPRHADPSRQPGASTAGPVAPHLASQNRRRRRFSRPLAHLAPEPRVLPGGAQGGGIDRRYGTESPSAGLVTRARSARRQ